MNNFEYDKLYDELNSPEQETGIIMSGSPTRRVGYGVLSELPKETRDSPMFSLDKTESVEGLQTWLGTRKDPLSWKTDGLTIVLTYEGGSPQKAVTGGNEEIEKVITANAKVFSNAPSSISYEGQLVLREEAVIAYSDSRRINEEIKNADAEYKNPRDLRSGSVRQSSNQITAEWNVRFGAFAPVGAEGVNFGNSRRRQSEWLKEQRPEVVASTEVTTKSPPKAVEEFTDAVEGSGTPSDGLMFTYDDTVYGGSPGRTAKFPYNPIAFKQQDEIRETRLDYIEWSAFRTGLTNPVAMSNLAELGGATVSRASVHSLSIMEGLELGAGDTITVYKANMIVSQIIDNLTRNGVEDILRECLVCGGETQIKQIDDVKSLYCINPDRQAKKIKSFTLFVSRDALNIDGLSEATLEKFIEASFIHEYVDIFHLDQYRDMIAEMDGFGQKSHDNLIVSIRMTSNTTLPRLVYGLGITGIGLVNAKVLCKELKLDFRRVRHAQAEKLVVMDGIEGVLTQTWMDYFLSEKNNQSVGHLPKEFIIELEQVGISEVIFEGVTFAITGSAKYSVNRKGLQEVTEDKGDKAAGSATVKTTYLINNDAVSDLSENKKARELGILVILEEELLRML